MVAVHNFLPGMRLAYIADIVYYINSAKQLIFEHNSGN